MRILLYSHAIYTMQLLYLFQLAVLCIVAYIPHSLSTKCGCKSLRPCYKEMLDTLLDYDETACIEDAAIGTSTIIVFLKAIKHFCGDVFNITDEHVTHEKRRLYEAVINLRQGGSKAEDTKPVIVLEAGMEGGSEPVMFALYVIEQLVGCNEYSRMIERVRWVILPCSNPDGLEYGRYHRDQWKKNMRQSDDQLALGVDITRNFDSRWGSCARIESGFSPIYPGEAPGSEMETIFVKDALSKYKNDIKLYVSIKRDGHSIGYPYAYTQDRPANGAKVVKVAAEVASRVNQQTGGVHLFVNDSIYNLKGRSHCGHNADYAYDIGIPLVYEMRVFLGLDKRIVSKFQTLPRGYEGSLRNGYFSGIRELYNAVVNEKKYGKIL